MRKWKSIRERERDKKEKNEKKIKKGGGGGREKKQIKTKGQVRRGEVVEGAESLAGASVSCCKTPRFPLRSSHNRTWQLKFEKIGILRRVAGNETNEAFCELFSSATSEKPIKSFVLVYWFCSVVIVKKLKEKKNKKIFFSFCEEILHSENVLFDIKDIMFTYCFLSLSS